MDSYKRQKQNIKKQNKQQGASLIMALIVLVVLTIFGTTGLREAITDLSTTQLFTDSDSAFQSAESGLRAAEKLLSNAQTEEDAANQFSANNITQVSPATANYRSSTFWDPLPAYNAQSNIKITFEISHTTTDSLDMNNPGLTTTYYKLTAKGNMNSINGAVVVQSIFAKRFP